MKKSMIMDAVYEIRQIEEQAQDIRKQDMEKARDHLKPGGTIWKRSCIRYHTVGAAGKAGLYKAG